MKDKDYLDKLAEKSQPGEVDWDSLYEDYRDRKLSHLYDRSNDMDMNEGVEVKAPSFIIVDDKYVLDEIQKVFRNVNNPDDVIAYEIGMQEVYLEQLSKSMDSVFSLGKATENVVEDESKVMVKILSDTWISPFEYRTKVKEIEMMVKVWKDEFFGERIA